MAGRPPKPTLVRDREGDQGKGSSGNRTNPAHPVALPDKPSWLSPEGSDVWDEYCATCAPGLLRLVHAMALAQLCEDKVLEFRLRRSLSMMEDCAVRSVERKVAELASTGEAADARDFLPGGPLGDVASSKDGLKLFRVLNQVVLRVQRQEQQFGLTPRAASAVDMGATGKTTDDLEDALCG